MVDNDRSVIEVAFVDTPPSLFGPEPGTATDAAGSADERGRALEGRLVVVTGASGLLGAAFAAEVVERGARVCLIGRDMDALRATTATLGPDAPTAHLRCDLASAEDVDSACDFIDRIGQPVDLLVHAAGIQAPTTIAAGSLDDLDEHYLLEVRGPYLLTQRLLPSLTESKGHVVFLTGPHSNPSDQLDAHRAISQAGVRAFAEELRREATPMGVRVLVVGAEAGLDVAGDGAGDGAFLRACAATVLDSMADQALEVTELRLRVGRVGRAERR